MNTFVETQLAEMAIPELAQLVMAELEKNFDSGSNLAILSWTKNKKQGSIEFMIRHIVPGEDSIDHRMHYEHLYLLGHKDNSWEMTFLKSSTFSQEYNYYESPLVPKAKEPQQLELFNELSGQAYTCLFTP